MSHTTHLASLEPGVHQEPPSPPRRRRPTTVSVLTAILLALAATLLGPLSSAQAADNPTCPGGSHSGEASSSGSCPALHNVNLQAGRAMPRDVFRGDSRPYQMIFRDGFTSRGTNYDLQQHLQGDRAHNSGYISTSESRQVSETFARSQGLANLENAAMRPRCSTTRMAVYSAIPLFGNWLLGTCDHGEVTAETYVYVIDPRWADDALYVPDQVRHHPTLSRYASQDEWAYVRHIPNYAIVGVHIYQMTARESLGYIQTRTITFRYDRFQENRAHADALLRGGVSRLYNPASDRDADWNDHTALLTGTANSWERGCTTINRCRGGGSGG